MKDYKFNIGDEVITARGTVGKITGICDCEKCKARGFYEPRVKYENGEGGYIQIFDLKSNFERYYKIGNYFFGNLKIEQLQAEFEEARDTLLAAGNRLQFAKQLLEHTNNESK